MTEPVRDQAHKSERLSLDDVEALARDVLMRAGASSGAANAVAQVVRAAERDGRKSHGLSSVAILAEQMRCNEVNGTATPTKTRPDAKLILVDAAWGLAPPAIDLGFDDLIRNVTGGHAALGLSNCGSPADLAFYAARIAVAGRFGLCFDTVFDDRLPVLRNISIAFPERTGPRVLGGADLTLLRGGRVLITRIMAASQIGKVATGDKGPWFVAADIDPASADPSWVEVMDKLRRITRENDPLGIDSRAPERARTEAAGVLVPTDLLERMINS